MPLNGTLAITVQQTFDAIDRLQSITQPHLPGTDSVTQFQYDGMGNATGRTDPNGNVLSSTYDPGDRLAQSTDAATGITAYVYDDNDNLLQVTAPHGAVTTYTYDALSRRLTETSPDRGTLTYTYDLADNLASVNDVRGVTVNIAYDDLNRAASITYPDANEDVTFVYDNCSFGKGRLCSRTDDSGTYAFTHDVYGNITQMDYTTLGVTYTTSYEYGAGHRVVSMTLPSGRTVAYQRDGLRRISRVDSQISGINTALASNINYRADGVITARQYGNAIAETRTYDQQGRLTQQTIGTADSVLLSYDANSNVLSRDTQTNTHAYGYDVLDRLDTETNDGATLDYTYDPNHNRLTQDDGVQVSQYAYGAGNNQLIGIDATTLGYDPAGNLTDDGQGQTYAYNDASRLSQVFDNALLTATYVYNALGQRMHKTTATGTTIFHYDLEGRLIGETADNGTPLRDYVWQDDSPIAQIEGDTVIDTLTYLHTDHLATPRLGTDVVGNVVWRWEGAAFGGTQPLENPTSINLRFPGQYADAESGLYYNWNRYYDPSTGRYVTSDPLGLIAGLNPFVYAMDNSPRFIDRTGLEILLCNRKARGLFELVDANHSYLWDTRTGISCGAHGSPGISRDNPKELGPGREGDQCRIVEGSAGREDEILECCNATGEETWVPFFNDCQARQQDCIEKSGLPNPGVPGKRFGPPCDPCETPENPPPQKSPLPPRLIFLPIF